MTGASSGVVPPGEAKARGAEVSDGTFYLLLCLECVDGNRPLPQPFGDPAERGKWAAAHTRGTGHETWRVWEEVRRA